MRIPPRASLRLLLPAVCWLLSSAAHAQVPQRQLPRSVVVEALAEPQPTAFAPADFEVQDFTLERYDGGDPRVTASLEPGTLEWVRTARVLVVPRAVVQVRVQGATRGTVTYADASQPMAADDAGLRADVPVALMAGQSYPLVVQAQHGTELVSAAFHVKFTPRPQNTGRVLFDSSCSPFGLSLRRGAIARDAWMYVGCSNVITLREERDTPALELYVLFDGAGDAVRVDGVPTPPTVDTVWHQRVEQSPGALTFSALGQRAELAYFLPERIHPGFLGVGFGPYLYLYEDDDDGASLAAQVPMLTLYAGYTVNPTMRIVYFNAAALHRRGFMDQGVYLWLEQLRALDDRFSLNLLLGANVLAYSHSGTLTARLSAPQGFELVMRDFLAVNRNLTAGAFLYPKIADRSYYNIWLRWGSQAFFGEVNYIAWKEPHGGTYTETHSIGLTFGIPVWRYLRFL